MCTSFPSSEVTGKVTWPRLRPYLSSRFWLNCIINAAPVCADGVLTPVTNWKEAASGKIKHEFVALLTREHSVGFVIDTLRLETATCWKLRTRRRARDRVRSDDAPCLGREGAKAACGPRYQGRRVTRRRGDSSLYSPNLIVRICESRLLTYQSQQLRAPPGGEVVSG